MIAALAPIDYAPPPAHDVRVTAIGRKVLLGIGSAIAYLTPDEAADLQAELQRAEAEARAVALRGAA